MASLRAVCRVLALILLCQTGLDLGVPSLCALDAEGAPGGSSTPLSSTLAVSPAPAHRSDTPSPGAGHVDDCFCCSGCVVAQAVFSVVPALRPSLHAHVSPDSSVPLLATLVFRPPQVLS